MDVSNPQANIGVVKNALLPNKQLNKSSAFWWLIFFLTCQTPSFIRNGARSENVLAA